MSKDTSRTTASRFYKLIMKKSPEERFLMGCSMFNASMQIVKSAVLRQYPRISESGMKKELFLKFYGMEFNAAQKSRILNELEEKLV